MLDRGISDLIDVDMPFFSDDAVTNSVLTRNVVIEVVEIYDLPFVSDEYAASVVTYGLSIDADLLFVTLVVTDKCGARVDVNIYCIPVDAVTSSPQNVASVDAGTSRVTCCVSVDEDVSLVSAALLDTDKYGDMVDVNKYCTSVDAGTSTFNNVVPADDSTSKAMYCVSADVDVSILSVALINADMYGARVDVNIY